MTVNNHRPLIQLLCKSASLKLYVRIELYNIPLYHTMVDMDRPNQNHKVAANKNYLNGLG